MSETDTTHYYIGKKDCAKATCNRMQEFPNGSSDYCIFHAAEDWVADHS
jgi:hypothetical protein